MKKGTIAFVFFSVVASAINYIAYPLLSRLLPSAQYTDITVSLSLLTQISTFLSSIIAITIGISKEESNDAHHKIGQLQSILLRTFTIAAVAFLALSPLLMPALSTPTAFAIPISLMMLASIPIAIVSGYLNGKNKLTKVGLVALMSAALQFIAGIATAVITKNGFLTMLLMGIAQITTVLILYATYSSDHLPSPLRSILKKIQSTPGMKSLVVYTIFASLAIMFVNTLQIADLLIVEKLKNVNVKFYTDIYVISRIVFFAGIIFVWPFLGKISIKEGEHNHRQLARLITLFVLIAGGAIITLLVASEWIVTLLFDANYSAGSVLITGSLSIAYKFFLLIITAVCLYHMVLRRYAAVYLAAFATIAILLFSLFAHTATSIDSMLVSLNIIGGAIAVTAILSVFLYPKNR